MQLITNSTDLQEVVQSFKSQYPRGLVGFVPTMGALHEGHMKLILEARKKTGFVIASVFVNPTQFNDPADLEKYPRTPQVDAELLQAHGCDVLYMPDVNDIYPRGVNEPYTIDFDGLDLVMEGKFRPGHFKGVAQVVERLFGLVKPDLAFFGRKDFQQVAIVNHLVQVRQIPVQIVPVDTVRSVNGLALSSRNKRLSEAQLGEALIIYKTLSLAKERAFPDTDPAALKKELITFFNGGKLRLEYLELVNDLTLLPVKSFDEPTTCCIAAYCGEVRLIDNMSLSADTE